MKQTELATRMGVREMWLSRRLRGAQPINLDDLQKIAAVLNVEVADLLPRSGEGRVLTTAGGHTGDQRVRTKGSSHRPTKRTSPFSQPKRTQPDRAIRRPARTSHARV